MVKDKRDQQDKKTKWAFLAAIGLFLVVQFITSFVADRFFTPSMSSRTLIENELLEDMVSVVAFGVTTLIVSLILLFRYAKPTILMVVDCFLLAILVPLPIAMTDYFNAVPNGTPQPYFSKDCGKGPYTVPANLPSGFICSAVRQNYGWPFTNTEEYTQVRTSDPRVNVTSFTISAHNPASLSLRLREHRRLPTLLYVGAVVLTVIVIIGLPIPAFKVWRKKVEGRTTFVLVAGAILVLLAISVYGLAAIS